MQFEFVKNNLLKFDDLKLGDLFCFVDYPESGICMKICEGYNEDKTVALSIDPIDIYKYKYFEVKPNLTVIFQGRITK